MLRITTKVDKNILEQLIVIDQQIYPQHLQGTMECCLPWLERNPEIYIVLLKDKKAIGYINMMPLLKLAFDQIKNGERLDSQLDINSIVKYDEPGDHCLYLCSIVILKENRSTTALRILYKAFKEKLKDLSERGIHFKEIVADAVTKEGEHMCGLIGMVPLRKTTRGSILFVR